MAALKHIKISFPQWLLLAMLSFQSIIFSADASAIEVAPPVAVQSEWLSDLAFLQLQSTSYFKFQPSKADKETQHSFKYFFNFPIGNALDNQTTVQLASAKWKVLRFDLPYSLFQQYISVKTSDESDAASLLS